MAKHLTARQHTDNLVRKLQRRADLIPAGETFQGGPLAGASVYNVHRYAIRLVQNASQPRAQAGGKPKRPPKVRGYKRFDSAAITFYTVPYGYEAIGTLTLTPPANTPNSPAEALPFDICRDYADSRTGAVLTRLLLALADRQHREARRLLDRIIALEK